MSSLSLFLENFHFLRPLLLLALLPAVILGLLLLFNQAQGSLWTRAVDPQLLPFLLDKSTNVRQRLHLYILLLIWILAIIALAGPVWKELPTPVQEREDALVVVLDLSLSMYANDLNPDRLTRAQRKLQDVLAYRNDEGQTGLVVYAGDAHAVTPLTSDVSTIRNMAPALQPNIMPQPGSNPTSGITLGLSLLDNAGIDRGKLLLITDGISAADESAIEKLINDTTHELSILGVGTDQGAPIPSSEGGFLRDANNAIVIPRLGSDILQSLANATGGRYSDIQLGDGDITYLLRQNILEENENLLETEREFDTWYEAGPWLLLLITPLVALAFRQGWLLMLLLTIFMLPAKPAMAMSWDTLWKNNNQRASEAFDQEKYAEAATEFDDARWRAASQYRQGNFEAAAQSLSAFDDAESHYNRGNALARMMQLEDAIAAYDATLALEPDHEDALHNKALLEDMLEQQQQNQQNSAGDNQEQQQEQQEQDQQDGQQGEQDQEQEQNQNQQGEQQNEQEQESEQAEQDGQQNQEQDQNQQEQEQEQSEEAQEQEQEQSMQQESRETDPEEEQSMQQWLGRIKDDPSELLRNKFRQQTQQRLFEEMRNPKPASETGNEQIW